jgi:hypothetical protein
MRPDAELVDSTLKGERAAYGELVCRYGQSVVAAAWQILGDYHAAQDAAQEVFLNAYQKLGSLRNGSMFGAWVLTSVRRYAYAVHQFKACADGMILVVSSIRRDAQTEKEFPSEYRSIRPGMMIAEAGSQQFAYDHQIELASAVHGPVLVQWWLLVPVPVYGPHGLIKPEPGKVMFRAELSYHDKRLWDKYQPGAKVNSPVEVLAVLDAPSRSNPLQRSELAARVYQELASLDRSAFTSMVVGREVATSGSLRGQEVRASKNPSEIMQQEYAERLAAWLNMREHESHDQLLRELKRLKEQQVKQPAPPREGAR